jgi:hypothetical protein
MENEHEGGAADAIVHAYGGKVARRLDGLLDEPRPGAPRQISDAAVERRRNHRQCRPLL